MTEKHGIGVNTALVQIQEVTVKDLIGAIRRKSLHCQVSGARSHSHSSKTSKYIGYIAVNCLHMLGFGPVQRARAKTYIVLSKHVSGSTDSGQHNQPFIYLKFHSDRALPRAQVIAHLNRKKEGKKGESSPGVPCDSNW